MRSRLALVAALLALSSSASAGVVVHFTSYGQRGGTKEKPETGTVSMQGDSVRVETNGQMMIFRGDKQLVWIVPPSSDTYMEMTKDSMQQVSSGADAAMAAMKDQLANMPPEQRAMVEKMMSSRATMARGAQAQAAAEPETLKATDKTDTIAGHATTAWDTYRGTEVVRESWVADWKSFSLTAADFKPLQDLGDFMRTLSSRMAGKFDSGFAAKYTGEGALPGVPLRVVSFSKMGASTHEITSIDRADLAASTFEVPADRHLEAMPMPPPMGGGR